MCRWPPRPAPHREAWLRKRVCPPSADLTGGAFAIPRFPAEQYREPGRTAPCMRTACGTTNPKSRPGRAAKSCTADVRTRWPYQRTDTKALAGSARDCQSPVRMKQSPREPGFLTALRGGSAILERPRISVAATLAVALRSPRQKFSARRGRNSPLGETDISLRSTRRVFSLRSTRQVLSLPSVARRCPRFARGILAPSGRSGVFSAVLRRPR